MGKSERRNAVGRNEMMNPKDGREGRKKKER